MMVKGDNLEFDEMADSYAARELDLEIECDKLKAQIADLKLALYACFKIVDGLIEHTNDDDVKRPLIQWRDKIKETLINEKTH